MVKIYTHKYIIKKLSRARIRMNFSIHGKSFLFKVITAFTGLTMLFQVFYPTVALALTGGPSQPEMQDFAPIGQANMVDLSTGGFSYNIPLMEVEGYPINLSYHSGVTMDQEASWVGLGWNINTGEINRTTRGLPDDFAGDTVTQSFNMKDNITVGLNVSSQVKLFGIPFPLDGTAGIFYNNYKGPGMQYGLSKSISAGDPNKGTLTGSLGLSFNSQSGLSPSIGFSAEANNVMNSTISPGVNVGASYSSRSGLKGLSMATDLGFLSGGVGSGGFISFGTPTYFPTMSMPINNYSVTLDATLGAAIIGLHPNITFSGYYNKQTLAKHTFQLPSYGYMYADLARDNPYALHDFNREKDVPFQQNIANLPITNFTYDLFSVSGEGVGGQFRPFRGDVGVLYDHECNNTSLSGSVGVELGFTELVHWGVQLGFNYSNTVSDKWTGNNSFGNVVDFKSLQPGNINYEPFYIKSIGENTVNDQAYYNTVANEWPARVDLSWAGSTVTAQNMFDYSNKTLYVGSNLTKTRREKRHQSTSILNAEEANYFGLDKTINSYPMDTNVYGTCSYSSKINHISRLSWPGHHMSEITVTNPDGKRYVYGIPAYNTIQKEATFSINSPTVNNPSTSGYYLADSDNVVPYSVGDNSTGNSKGLDNYFNEQTIPSYSHSFLLTGILSPDYVDLTNDGITDDDQGEAVKFNYTRVYSKAKPYRWRTPFQKDSAGYQLGLMSYSQDDKANYIYGEKEIWYTHSIESKTMIAQFVLQDRHDAFGVKDSNGGIDSSNHLKCIKEIDLYSKADLIKNGVNAVPIKTVHFVYTDSLCPGVPNSTAMDGRGKLTLKRIYFTFGNNNEGSINSYAFSYSTFNPKYSNNHYDRWGYFKTSPAGMPANEDFPYTLQDSTRTNLYATAWNMTGIDLPSGGHITVKYESNDYGYVQNHRAGQMFIIKGVGLNSKDSTGSALYSKASGLVKFNDWIFVRLPEAVTSNQDFYNKYLAGVDSINPGGNPVSKLYFRFLVNVGNVSQPAYEYVPGYCDISQDSMINPHLGAIKISEVSSGEKIVGNANPVSLASWQFLRLNLPQDAYPGSQVTGSPLSIIEFLLGIIPDVIDIFTGFDTRAELQNFGKYIIPANSYVRLDNPNYKKLGGGARVKEIDVSDNWSTMASGGSTSQYGQTYSYTTTLPNGQVVSTGVATYEPMTGDDENPLRQPLGYDEKTLLAPNNHLYTETPLGESLYPSPGVVYSQVTVANLKHTGVNRTATGYTVNKFYTARDFPVQNSWTDLVADRVKPSVLQSIFSVGVQDFMTASQGFVVEVNDMAGKEKSQTECDKNGSIISSVQYYYKVDNTSAPALHLNNSVQVVNPGGSVTTASVGEDIDVWEDMREQDTQTQGIGVSFNNESFIVPIGILPLFLDILALCPDYSSEHTRFRSAVTTKYIHRTGLLDHITKTQNGSQVTTQNLLYDGETGDVLLTQTNNEFNKPIYSFTYPAHWAYDRMGSAYQNIGFEFAGLTTSSTGAITNPSTPGTYFTPGDEIESFGYVDMGGQITPDTLSRFKGWITRPQAGGSYVLMNVSGQPMKSVNALVKVIRSGRRNMPGVPVGSVVSMNSPIDAGDSIKINQGTQILEANATMFNEAWKIPYASVEVPVCVTNTISADTCLGHFLDSIITHHQVFAKASDNINMGKYVNAGACHADSAEAYYAITAGSTGMDQIPVFQAQLGNSLLTISTTTGAPVYLDSLNAAYFICPEVIIPGQKLSWDSITSNGCLNMWLYRRGSPTHCFSHPVLAATACRSTYTCHDSCENLTLNSIFNPYAQGMLGNWRPEKNYVYYDSRSPALASTKTNIWNTGIFNHYHPIWDVPTSGTTWNMDTTDKNWTWPSMITMYDPKGNEIEEQNALGLYSSVLFGYIKSLPVAQSSNAKFEEIASDGFEDYGFTTTCSALCDNSHFSFISAMVPTVSDTTSAQAHTGKYSFMIGASHNASVMRYINYYNGVYDSTTSTGFYLKNGGNIPLFSPDSGSYILSAWVKENTSCGVTGYTKDSIVVSYTGSTTKYVMKPSGPVMEGWQRFESRFNVPGKATAITVELVAGANTAYYDDIRIEPYAAQMQSFVYDPSSLRLLANLDENNYATIYEYNDEEILMRVKKETERGIMTIKESRSSYPRKK